MNFLGHTEITTIEEPDRLEFVFVWVKGWFDAWIVPCISAGLMIGFWVAGHYLYSLSIVLVGLVLIARSFGERTTRLFVSARGLAAHGSRVGLFTKDLSIPAEDIESLFYSSGGEDESSGLYVKLRKGTRCVIPGLGKMETNRVLEPIQRRFPHLLRAEPPNERMSWRITIGES